MARAQCVTHITVQVKSFVHSVCLT